MADDNKGTAVAEAPNQEEVEYVWVKSGRSDDRVALHERDNLHPADALGNHDIYVAGRDSRPVLAALTPEVDRRLRTGDLLEVDEDAVVEWHQNREDRRQAHLAMLEGGVNALDPATQKVLQARGMGDARAASARDAQRTRADAGKTDGSPSKAPAETPTVSQQGSK